MTTLFAFLPSLQPIDYAFIGIAWLLVAAALGTFTGLGIRLADRREQPVVNLLTELPPVPAPVTPPYSQTTPDADWFDGLPCDVLSDEAVHSLFDRLVDMDLPELKGLES